MSDMSFDDIPEGRGSGSMYFTIDIGQGKERLKIDRESTMTAIIVPYITTCSRTKKPGDMHFMRDYFLYRNLGPEQKDSYFDCVQTFGEKCPIGDFAKQAGAKLVPQRKALFNLFVVDIDGVEVNKPYVLDHSFANFAAVLRMAAENKSKRRGQENAKFFMSPDKGSYVTWSWKEDTFNRNKFYVAADFDFSPHNGFDGKMPELIAGAVDLDKALNKLPYDEAKARFIDGFVTAPAAPAADPAAKSTPKPNAPVADAAVAAAVEKAKDDAPFDAGWE